MKKANKKSGLHTEISFWGIRSVDILLFTKHLSITLRSGLTLIEGLEILVDQARGRLRKVLADILATVRTGEAFNVALSRYSKYFVPIYINMVKTGEESGNLEKNLFKLSEQLEKAQRLKKKVRAAMIYPTMVFVAVFGLGMSVAIFVLPKMLPLFRTLDVELPVTTRGLIWVAEIFEKHGLVIAIGTIGGGIIFSWLLKRDFVKPVTHRIVLKTPVVNRIIRNVSLERFTRTLGSLLESGLTIDRSLEIVRDGTSNRVYKKAIATVIPSIRSGTSLKESLEAHEDLFPLIAVRMIGVGERTGNLDTTLQYLGVYYEDNVDDAMKNLSTVLEPLLLIIIGGVVGTVAIAILGPIYEITGNLR